LPVDLVHFHYDLVVGLRDTGTQVLIKQDRVPRAQDDRSLVDLVRDRQRCEPIPARLDQAAHPAIGEQLHAFSLAQALQHTPGTRSRAGAEQNRWQNWGRLSRLAWLQTVAALSAHRRIQARVNRQEAVKFRHPRTQCHLGDAAK
jgi:hypothetical protein